MGYYACKLTEEELMNYTNTNKRISSAIDNLSILDTNEYVSLYAFFIYESCANNFVWRFTGACYLILLYERDPVRFKENFTLALKKAYGSVNSLGFYEDFYDLESILELCDADVYEEFLKISCNSSNEEIKTYAMNLINNTLEIDTESIFYKTYMAEYAEFKRKLDI